MIVHHDGATGRRTALSATEVGAHAAATAALLTDECGLRAGDRAAVLLPPHWQTATVLLGIWSAGIEVAFHGWGGAGLGGPPAPAGVTFVHRPRIGSWLEEVPHAPHRFVLGTAAGDTTPDGYRDYAGALAPHLGARPPAQPRPDDVAAPGGTTHDAYGALAAEIARARGIHRGDRVLINAATSEEPLIWLLAPLTAGASIVLCSGLDAAGRTAVAARERVTRVL